MVMMTIELKDVEHLAGLARIAVSEEEKKILQHDLEEILAYVSQVKHADRRGTDAEERGIGDLRNVMRDDIDPHESGVFTEDLLTQAPAREGNRISVKKIL